MRPPSPAAQSAQHLQLPAKVAGRKIARFWRRIGCENTTLKIVRKYIEVVKKNGELRTLALEEMTLHLKQENTRKAAKECFGRIIHLCTQRHGPAQQPAMQEPTQIARITAAYLITHHTRKVFTSIGDNERVLIAAAEQLLLQFHTIVDCIDRSRPCRFAAVDLLDTVGFFDTVATYLTKFRAWQEPDQALMIARIRTALLGLYAASSHMPSDSSAIRMEIVVQITRLRKKYEDIAGAAQLASFDAAHNLDVLPAPVLGASETLLPMENPETGERVSVQKRQLAHEILIDPNLTITETNFSLLGLFQFQEARQMRAEFWEKLRANLATGDYTHVFRVLNSLRDTLYTSCTESEYTRIRQELPLERFAERAAQGQVAWEDVRGLLNTIAVLVKDIMKPERQDDFEARWILNGQRMDAAVDDNRVEILADTLSFFSEISFLMSIDAANNRIGLIKHVVRDHGYEYMVGTTRELISSGKLALVRTARWIFGSLEAATAAPQTFAVIARILQLESKADFCRRLVRLDQEAVSYFHYFAVVHLVTAHTEEPFTVDTLPESLCLDLRRLVAARDAAKHLVAACTFITRVVQTAQSIVRDFTDARPQPLTQADARDVQSKEMACGKIVRATTDFLSKVQFSDKDTIEKDSRRLSQRLQAHLDEVQGVDQDDVALFKRSVYNSASPTDPVHSLVRTRVRDEIVRQLYTTELPDMAHYTLPSQTRIMTPFEIQIIGGLDKLIKVNSKVYLGAPPQATSFCGGMVVDAAQRLLDEELHFAAVARDVGEMAVAD